MADLLYVSTSAEPWAPPGRVPPPPPHPAPPAGALPAPLDVDAVLLDGRTDLVAIKSLCGLFRAGGLPMPLLLVLPESPAAAPPRDWGVTDFVVETAGPAEVDARLRLLQRGTEDESGVTSVGAVTVNEANYSVTVAGEPLDLTYTEFELLRYLVQHPGRVHSREHLLSQVWGYDYYGGTRTVDVHIRRLRAKLGPEHETLIGTVRNVGYHFTPRG